MQWQTYCLECKKPVDRKVLPCNEENKQQFCILSAIVILLLKIYAAVNLAFYVNCLIDFNVMLGCNILTWPAGVNTADVVDR